MSRWTTAVSVLTATLLAASLFLAACDETSTDVLVPFAIELTGGDGQVGVVGESLAQPLSVRILDNNGDPMAGVLVDWSMVSGGGSLPGTSITGADGIAEASWSLGTTAGGQSARASAEGPVSAGFSATAEPGPTVVLVASEDSLSFAALAATVGLSAGAEDAFGNEVDVAALEWRSTEESIASVDASGSVMANANGSAMIVASLEGVADTVVVAVDQEVASVAIEPQAPDTLVVGDTLVLTATVQDANGHEVVGSAMAWSSSDSAVALVEGGVVTAAGSGTAEIVLTADDVASSAVAVTVAAGARSAEQLQGGVAVTELAGAEGSLTDFWIDVPDGETLTVTTTGGTGDVDLYLSYGALVNASNAECASEAAANEERCTIAAAAGGAWYIALFGYEAYTGVTLTATVTTPAENSVPDVTITSPASGDSITEGSEVSMVGSATDAEDGTLMGSALVWSSDLDGELGSGSEITAVLAVGTHVITLTATDSEGANGAASVSVTVMAPPAGSTVFRTIVAATEHACGVAIDDAAYCWGSNTYYQLGDGTYTERRSPSAVAGGLSFDHVTGGRMHSCGVTPAGVAYCWGGGLYGDSEPVPVEGAVTFAVIDSGEEADHTCALTPAGDAYCWGDNTSGQLGNGGQEDSEEPVAVSGGLTFASITLGADHTCALTPAGEAYCWGYSYAGRVGAGVPTDEFYETSPVPVAGGLTFASITAGAYHSCGVTPEGAAWCWGNQSDGRLGIGSTSGAEYTPVAVEGGLEFTAVTAGANHTCGVTTGGDTYCWGANDFGQLGNGTTSLDSQRTPAPSASGLTFTTLSAGSSFTCGVTGEGEGYCWGINWEGQLGNGATSDWESSPRRVDL